MMPAANAKKLPGLSPAVFGHEVGGRVEARTVEPPEQLLGSVHEEDPRERDSRGDESEVDRTTWCCES